MTKTPRLAFAVSLLLLAAACKQTGTPGASSSSTPTASPTATAAAPRVPRLNHVWLFVFENHSYEHIIGNPDAPYLNDLASTWAIADRFYARRHPSLPNYLSMIAGSAMGCESDTCGAGFAGETLAGQFVAEGKKWAGYFEDLPVPAYVGGDRGGYVKHHDPFAYFTEVTDHPDLRSSILPLTAFKPSLSDPPSFSMIVPNNAHNMHTGSVAQADAWAKDFISPVISSDAFQDHGLVIITWDEGDASDEAGCCAGYISGGHIATIVVASDGKRGFHSTVPHTTFSICATIEDGFGLGHLRKAGTPAGTAMGEFWD